MINAVTRWFGPEFRRLHPLLQHLHERGGWLQGVVKVRFGKGIAGWIGRRLAAKLGIPPAEGAYPFSVHIWHDAHALHWDRIFNESSPICSTFTPMGNYAQGYWQETTGFLHMRLGVEIRQGGWHWVQQGLRLGWLPIPLCLVPGSSAYKYVENDQYVFKVSFMLPLFGELLRYAGRLQARAAGD